jgi:hypothetical protein
VRHRAGAAREDRSDQAQYLPGIKKQVGIAKEKRQNLGRPSRTARSCSSGEGRSFVSGIKVGLKKAKGLIEWADEQSVIRLIRKTCPRTRPRF